MGKDSEGKNLPTIRLKTFEELKKVNPYGAEYWSARDLQPLLGYNHWRSFENAIDKAIISCEQSGNNPDYHFVRARKMIILGKGGERKVSDYHLSRFACSAPHLELEEQDAKGLLGGQEKENDEQEEKGSDE
jgi:hypothetical protein